MLHFTWISTNLENSMDLEHFGVIENLGKMDLFWKSRHLGKNLDIQVHSALIG